MSTFVFTSVETDYERIVDRIDSWLADAFGTSHSKNTDDDLLRYWLLVPLLEGFGESSLGLSVDRVRASIEKAIGNDIALVDENSTKIKELLVALIKPSYTAVSYWSPLDGLRHTITHRPTIATSDEKTVLAYAYAFYALTHVGAPHSLYSVVQYISESAMSKLGVRVCYKDQPDAASAGPEWWHIPLRLHEQIMNETGVTETVNRVLLQGERFSIEQLEKLLGLCLSNVRTVQQQWQDVDSFAEKFVHRFFDRGSFSLSPELTNFVEQSQVYLSSFFESDIEFKQALFMLTTQVVYRKACPADYVYTYPVRVARTCCVLTVGTEEPLDQAHNLAVGSLAKSIFTHPLLIDFAAKEADARLEAETNALWKNTIDMVGHRIGNPLFNIRANLDSLRYSIDESQTEEAKIILGELDYSANKIKTILDDVKRYLQFQEVLFSPVSLGQIIGRACIAARRRGFVCDEIKCLPDVQVFGNSNLLEECFDELIANSARWCLKEPKIIRIEVSRVEVGQLPSTLGRNKKYVRIKFIDNGPGVADNLKSLIFNPLFTTHAEGNGMGLAWINRKVKQHGGAVSEVGQFGDGVNFTIFLPEPNNASTDGEQHTISTHQTTAQETHNAESIDC